MQYGRSRDGQPFYMGMTGDEAVGHSVIFVSPKLRRCLNENLYIEMLCVAHTIVQCT
jgi:hypothetical protein